MFWNKVSKIYYNQNINKKKMETQFKSLNEARTAIVELQHTFFEIKTISEFNKLVFDPTAIDDEGAPKVTAQQLMILICENSDFNETYLIDKVYQILKEDFESKEQKYQNAAIVYIKDTIVRNYIGNPKEIECKFESEEVRCLFEKELPTICGIVIPEKNDIYLIKDTPLTVIETETLRKFFNNVSKEILIDH